jgi:hypothetical protein
MAQVAGKYGEYAPTGAVCCNACRTCATTNLVSLGMARSLRDTRSRARETIRSQ